MQPPSEDLHARHKILYTDILEALTRHKHPFILIGERATLWMGCGPCTDTGCDLLIRETQLSSIVAAISSNGNWECIEVDNDDPEMEYHMSRDYICCDADAVLRNCEEDGELSHLRLWTDRTYHLDVDTCDLIQIPHVDAWDSVLVEDEYHPARGRTDGWWYGPRTLNRLQGAKVKATHPPLSEEYRIYIPSIPRYIDALASQQLHLGSMKRGLCFLAARQIGLLFRYLYLDLWHQEGILKLELEGGTTQLLQQRWDKRRLELGCRRFSRKVRTITSVTDGKLDMVRVLEWDPDTYPEKARKEIFEYLQALPCPWRESLVDT